ncbi:MAG: tyrosine-type recombinase/integrase [Polyangia bacterium]|jgi:integrase|nr:tyrosine-type recombinase/integrase [Myxococcales bacterium]
MDKPKLYGPYAHRGGFRFLIVQGQERTATPSAPTEERARQIAEAFLRKLVQPQVLTVGMVLDQYSDYLSLMNKPTSVATAMYRLQTLIPQRALPIKRLTARHCEDAYMELVKRQKPDTHRNALAVAKTFGKWCLERKLLAENPFAAVKPLGKRSRGKVQLTRDEARLWLTEALAQARDGSDGALVASMVLLMGIRPSEALLRLVRDIDDRGTRLRIREAKTRAGDRDPKIPDVLRKLIAARCEGKPRDALIFSTQDRTGRAIPRKADWVLDAVRRICKASGVPTICTYSLRGLHADLAIEAGTVPDVVAESLGHTSKEITMGHYAKPGTLADVTAQRAAQQLGVCDAPN